RRGYSYGRLVSSVHQPCAPATQWPVREPAPSSRHALQTTFESVAAQAGSVALPARNTTAAAASWESFIGTSPWLAASRNGGCSAFRSANEGGVPALPSPVSRSRGFPRRLSGIRGEIPRFTYGRAPAGTGRRTHGSGRRKTGFMMESASCRPACAQSVSYTPDEQALE